MALSRWICMTGSTKNMLVKIVHQGGHVEFHNRPILASEVMNRNPRCIVARPHVFREPESAIVSPDTVLMLGQEFYVVPVSIIRKLRMNSFKYSPNNSMSSLPSPEEHSADNEPKVSHEEGRKEGENASHTESNYGTTGEASKGGKCYMCLPNGLKMGDKLGHDLTSIFGSSETNNKRSHKSKDPPSKGSPIIKGFSSSLKYWQPSLESITEE